MKKTDMLKNEQSNHEYSNLDMLELFKDESNGLL